MIIAIIQKTVAYAIKLSLLILSCVYLFVVVLQLSMIIFKLLSVVKGRHLILTTHKTVFLQILNSTLFNHVKIITQLCLSIAGEGVVSVPRFVGIPPILLQSVRISLTTKED